jgi:sec-independent protein translocase protein TatB|tara:strand:+ start:3966 stop:4199 length:234 start_codon:yes stop_codon:yes gene_type:complete
MPQIGWLEILIIVSLSIIIIGPKDFPFVLKKIGSWIGSVKTYINNFQEEISKLSELDDEKNPQKTKLNEKENNDETK